MEYIIYTDGAYSPNRNVGGIGFVILNSSGDIVGEFLKKFENTTNQRTEQLAVAIALESVKVPSKITVYSDSAYVVNTYNNNWKRKCNNDLWDRIDKAILFHESVTFKHIKGHQSCKNWNNFVDKLAVEAYG